MLFFFESRGLWDVTVTPGGKRCWKFQKKILHHLVVRLNSVFNITILLTDCNGHSPFVRGMGALPLYKCAKAHSQELSSSVTAKLSSYRGFITCI